MEPEPEIGFPEDVERLAAKALRPERRLSAEDLVASELASAILSEPLSKIRHVCEALMLLDESERKQAGITEAEVKEVGKLYAIATALQNAHINKELDLVLKVVIDRYAMVPWPFPCERAAEQLKWLGEDFFANYHVEGEGYGGKIEKKLKALPHFEKIYEVTSHLEATMDTYRGLIIRFVDFAMPKAAVLMKKIIRLVSPDSYRQALQILRGGKRGKSTA